MRFNYALNYEAYSCRNALLWGNCCKHFQNVKKGRLGHRFIHLLIGIVEFLPIISQISSIFEMMIVKRFGDRPTTHTSTSAQNKEKEEKESFETFKTELLRQLPAYKKLQGEHPTYRRGPLELVTSKTRNPTVRLDQYLNFPDGNVFYSRNVVFYGYNAEGIRDYKWGCAWRAIQTSLSSYDLPIPFENLFHLFGPLRNLQRIYKDKYPRENLPSHLPFAPYDTSSGWAEPFIGEMVMHFFGISSQLESINAIPSTCFAPKEVLHNRPSMTFADFITNVERHFKTKGAAPIIIDDGTYTLNVVGIGSNEFGIILWIADPHINEGVNSNLRGNTPNGFYRIALNREDGAQIGCSLSNVDRYQVDNLFAPKHATEIRFNEKPWMVLFPTSYPIRDDR